MTRVVVLPADETACGYYRLRMPAWVVGQQRPDWQVDVYRPGDVKLGIGADGRLWAVQGIADVESIDLVVMQRVATPAQVELIRWFQAKGTAVVVDADDAMWAIDPDNAAHGAWNGAPHHWRNLDAAAEFADLMTVTTQVLSKRYAKHGRCVVLPNCVPTDVQNIQSVRSALDQTTTIGWAGTTLTHPGDLAVVGDAVRQVQADTGCIVRVIGDAEGASRDWGCPVEKVNPTSIGAAYFTALTALDIGLVPLRDSTFNKGKSYLKALEFAASGLAVVASDTPANRELAKTVPILLATSPEEWRSKVQSLVQNPELREIQADRGMKAVQEVHTYEGNATRWIAAWERAMARRARMLA